MAIFDKVRSIRLIRMYANDRCVGILKRRHLEELMRSMVAAGDAAYEPEKQTSAVMLYWRRPEQWAETIHEWVRQSFHDFLFRAIVSLTDCSSPACLLIV